MREVLLYCVALPCTQEVEDILNFLSITNAQQPSSMQATERCGLFIYDTCLEIEAVDHEEEWVIDIKDVPTVLAMYANKDFKGICEYLNNIPERPFNVYINSTCLPR